MRGREKTKIANRVLAAVLSVFMVFSLIPVSALSVSAATTEHPDAVTITVKDEAGVPLSGASVVYTIDSVTNGDSYKTGTLTTDDYGTVEVLPSADYAEGDLSLTATVSKQGYTTDDFSINKSSIDADDKDYSVVINSTTITGIVVTPASETYAEDGDGNAQEYDAVSVSGEQKGDKVSYSTNNGIDYSEDVPKISAAGEYPITVKVERKNFDDYTEEVTAQVKKAGLDVTVTPLVRNYIKGQMDDAVSVQVKDQREGDVITYQLKDGTESENPPQIEAAGEYEVTVKVHRNDNYEDFTGTYTAEIKPVDIEGLSATLYSGTYDGKEHEAVLGIEGMIDGDVAEYQLDGGAWSGDIPKVEDAGTYTVGIRVERKNYNDTKIIDLTPATVEIYKANQEIKFKKEAYQTETTLEFDQNDSTKNVFDFSAAGGSLASPVITYSVENDSEEDTTGIAEIAEIDANGSLTVKKAGFNIKVTATVAGDSNYNDTSAECHVTIPNQEKDLLSFADKTKSYVVGTNSVISDQTAVKVHKDDNGTVTYSAKVNGEDVSSNEELGISINKNTGELTADYEKLSSALVRNGDALTIVVTASKTAGTKKQRDGIFDWKGKVVEVYPVCEAAYNVEVSFENTPADTYKLQDPSGKALTEPNGTNGWYNTAVTVVPATDGYAIARDSAADFGSSVEFNNQGKAVRKIYLKNNATGGITAPVTVDVEKIDSVKPDSSRITVEYSEPALSKLAWFYDAPVTVTFTAYDEVSGIDHFTWNYTRSSDASVSNLEADGGILQAKPDTEDSTKYTAEITLPKSEAQQLRGYLTVNATDRAGLTSEDKRDDGRTIIVDTVSPTEKVSYELAKVGGTTQEEKGQHYFSGDVEFTFHVTEANFYEEDVIVKVSKDQEVARAVEVSWSDTANQDEHEAKYLLSGDGDYVVTMEYKDRMAHQNGKYVRDQESVTAYTSEIVTIDTTPPVIEFSYSNGDHTSAKPDNAQTATISVRERNFRASDLTVDVTAKDIHGSDVAVNNIQDILQNGTWKQKGDVHTITLSEELADAVYEMTFHYKDIVLHPAEDLKTGKFIVDHTAPDTSAMKVSYSLPWTERVLSAVTFGYYNPDVTVTFEAKDLTSGVDYFTWSYAREKGTSEINVKSYADTKLSAESDPADPSKSTASIVLPLKAAEQLRGNIAFTATDQYGNTSKKITDKKHRIVVDTIAPTMTAEYAQASRIVGRRMYYNKNVTATFTVNEANFYKEDVVIELSKNGGDFVPVSSKWKDVSADVHVGTCTIKAPQNHSGDGDYVFRVKYTDRSKNKMKTYKSNTITVDTIKPVMEVSYSNRNVINTMKDAENHERQYFDETQTATITVTEHNFKADEVDFRIIARDAAGRELEAGSLARKTSWSTRGDKHTLTITYPGDANYTFDAAYTDLAANKVRDYEEDYFTVDKGAPTNLNVSYSSSVLDTVLQAVTFGFYNARTTVTITADDQVAGVHGFHYNCTLASGVSSVNAELINQAMDEAGVTYSNVRGTAATQFDIPRDALGNSNQFHGNISFTATDRSGNESAQFSDQKRIVVDNISPTSDVAYNTPVQESGGVAYYDGAVNATVTVNEANFYAEDVEVSVTRDGASYPVTPSWSDSSADVHVGTFNLNDDGDYFVTINYEDKSQNTMATYTSDQITVDTEIEEPVIMVNGEEADGKAFKDEVIPEVSFEDINFENYEIQLTRTRYDERDADVTETFMEGGVSTNDQGGTGSFDTFEKDQDVDGIYTMTVSMEDKAGHSSEASATFTVNRFGSVYEYNDYLGSLIKDGGAYVRKVENDLVITEYNPDRLVSDSLDIEISKDGKPMADVDYRLTPQINDQVSVGSSGWYQYEYTIAKNNFDTDGIYKISVSSADVTGNAPETTNYKDKNILFRVDSTAPEIDSITGLEKEIINAQSATAKYTVYDTIGLASIKVYVDGKVTDTITDFSEDLNNYNGSFTVSEKNSPQSVRLVVKDLAGNVTDTASDKFESAYAFSKSVTVSTNTLVRFYANKPLFWGTIIGALAVTGIVVLTVAWKRKKAAGREKERK